MQNNLNNFKLNFWQNNTLFRIIYFNVAVFLAVNIIFSLQGLFTPNAIAQQFVTKWFAIPAQLSTLITRPWTFVSYMFLHFDFSHLIINMLVLYMLGSYFYQMLGAKKLWTVYISGGVTGGLLYIIFFNIFPVFREILPNSIAFGASASVMAIVAAVGTYAPNFQVSLLFLGKIKLKYIAIILFLIDMIHLSDGNAGGHIAHIGGAILGYFFAVQWKKGKDITTWVDTFSNTILNLFKPKPKVKVAYKKQSKNDYEYNSRKKDEQAQVDAILDKIARSGYDSLSKTEKAILFDASNKN